MWQTGAPPRINRQPSNLPSMSSTNSPSATVNPGHRHKHITIHGFSHIQLSPRRQLPSSATLLQTSNHYSALPIHTLPILDTCPKTVPTLLNNTIRNPAIFLLFQYFSFTRSTKKVNIENLSLNKWKTWSAEFSQDCKKCEKDFTRWKLKLRRQIWRFLNFQTCPRQGQTYLNFFLIIFYLWKIEIGVRMQKFCLFYERTMN